MPPYERFEAWQRCHELVLEIYTVTATFPKEEKYGLTSQSRRAAFSAAANIAEGSARRVYYPFGRINSFYEAASRASRLLPRKSCETRSSPTAPPTPPYSVARAAPVSAPRAVCSGI